MDKLYTGYKVLKGNTDYINTCMNDKNYINSFLCNEYLIIINTDTGNESEMRFDGEKFVNLKLPPSRVIKGKNALQRCALDLLNNKDITIVTILGTYGSGKSFLTAKMALYSVLDRGWQSKVFGIREPVGEGSPCGYLPGELDNKIADFLKPITQYVEKEYFDVENLKQRGVFDGNIPYYLKGVDLDHCVVLCEEAEDFSEKQIRLIGTRLSEGSRIFLSGDYAQSVFNSSLSNPLVKMCDELKGNPLFGCIALQDDVRSETSRLFANLFR